MRSTKLVVLRGPSGAGKSTVARMLFEEATQKLALIRQDHYRFIFKPEGGGGKPNLDVIREMIKHNALVALSHGYDVILEGILSVGSYGQVLDEIFEAHRGENYMFYFDISLAETLMRHAMRKSAGFGDAELKEWYGAAHKSGHPLEQFIPERFTAAQTVEFIKTKSGL